MGWEPDQVSDYDPAVVRAFLALFDGGHLALHLGPQLTCTEVEAFAAMLVELGDPAASAWLVQDHARSDQPGDQHYDPGVT